MDYLDHNWVKYRAPWTTWVGHGLCGGIGGQKESNGVVEVSGKGVNHHLTHLLPDPATRVSLPAPASQRVPSPAPDLRADYTLGHNCHFTYPFELILFALASILENTQHTSVRGRFWRVFGEISSPRIILFWILMFITHFIFHVLCLSHK